MNYKVYMYKSFQNKCIDLDDLLTLLRLPSLDLKNGKDKKKIKKDQSKWLSMSKSGTNNVKFKYNCLSNPYL